MCVYSTTEQVPCAEPGYGSLLLIRKLLDLVTPNVQSVYNPNEEMSIGEAMIPSRGVLALSNI